MNVFTYAAIGDDLQGFGGLLRCTTCGHEQPLGDVGNKLRDGWPKCCGYTMRWWTARQLVVSPSDETRRDAPSID